MKHKLINTLTYFLIATILIICLHIYSCINNRNKGQEGDDEEFIPQQECTPKSKHRQSYMYGPHELIKLVKLETLIYNQIQDYVRNTNDEDESIKAWILDYESISLKEFKSWWKKQMNVSSDVEDFDIISGHPLLSYRMIRRYTNEFPQLLSYLSTSTFLSVRLMHSLEELKSQSGLRYGWPTSDDLKDSIIFIITIQDTYGFKVSDVANGNFDEVETGIQLDLKHIFEIGVVATSEAKYTLALEWLLLAKNMTLTATEVSDNRKAANLSVWSKNIDFEIQNLIEEHNSNWKTNSFGPAPNQLDYFLHKLDYGSISLNNYTIPPTVKSLGFEQLKGNRTLTSLYIDYYAVCAGENFQTPNELRQLHCYYEKNEKRKETWIYPAKIEQVSIEPPIFIIHDLVGTKVINKIKSLSIPTQIHFEENLNYVKYIYPPMKEKINSTSYNMRMCVDDDNDERDTTGVQEYFNTKSSANSWFDESIDPDKDILYLSRRLESIVGLNVVGESSSDPYEVVTYGSGGRFTLHLDALEEAKTDIRGDRINTIFIYLSNVLLGGRTAFPEVGVSFQPNAGSALVWNNLLPDGSADQRKYHTGCPVILGHKWSVNKCCTENGNFLTWKCDSSYLPENL